MKGGVFLTRVIFIICIMAFATTFVQATCIAITADNTDITENTTLCQATYNITDADNTGVIRVTGNNLILDCNNSILNGTGRFGISVTGSNNTVKNCDIISYDRGIRIGAKNNILEYSRFTGGTLYGMEIYNSVNSTVKYNNFTDNLDMRVYNNNKTLYGKNISIIGNRYVNVTNSIRTSDTTNIMIANNTVINCSTSGSIACIDVITSVNATIKGNTVQKSTGTQGIRLVTVSNTVIDDNSLSFIATRGIDVIGSFYTVIRNNYIVNSSTTGHYGIIMSNSSNTWIKNNTLINVTGTILYATNSYNVSFVKNNISKVTQNGISLDACMNCSIINNTIINQTNPATTDLYLTYVKDSESVIVKGNNYFDWENYAILFSVSNGTVNNNYFESESNTLGGVHFGSATDNSNISNNVFNNISGAFVSLGDANQEVYNNLFTNDSSPTNPAFPLTSSALSLSSNIRIYNNTFKNLYIAIFISGQNHTVYNNTFDTINQGISSSSDYSQILGNYFTRIWGSGIYFGQFVRNVTISNNTFIDNYGLGFQTYSFQSNHIITDNYAKNNSNGMQLNYINNSIIANNTIINNRWTGLIFSSVMENVTVKGNNISYNGENGIALYHATVKNPSIRITRNNIKHNGNLGLFMDFTVKVIHPHVFNNTITNNYIGMVTMHYLNFSYNNTIMNNTEADLLYYVNRTTQHLVPGQNFSFTSNNGNNLTLDLPNTTNVTLEFTNNITIYNVPMNGVYKLYGNISDSASNRFGIVKFIAGTTFTNRTYTYYLRGGQAENYGDFGMVNYSFPTQFGQWNGNGHDVGVLMLDYPDDVEIVKCDAHSNYYFRELYSQMKGPSKVHATSVWANITLYHGNTTIYGLDIQVYKYLNVTKNASGKYFANFDFTANKGPLSVRGEYFWHFVSVGVDADAIHVYSDHIERNNYTVNYSTLSYNLSYIGNLSLEVYDIDGRFVDSLSSTGILPLTVDQVYTLNFTSAPSTIQVTGATEEGFINGNYITNFDLLTDTIINVSAPALVVSPVAEETTGGGGGGTSKKSVEEAEETPEEIQPEEILPRTPPETFEEVLEEVSEELGEEATIVLENLISGLVLTPVEIQGSMKDNILLLELGKATTFEIDLGGKKPKIKIDFFSDITGLVAAEYGEPGSERIFFPIFILLAILLYTLVHYAFEFFSLASSRG